MSRLVDLSHRFGDGTVTYPGLPAPEITEHLGRADSEAAYGPGTTFHIGRITMVANTGTYVDSPFHRYAGGVDLANLPLTSLADLDGLLVSLPDGQRAVTPVLLDGLDVAGRALLLRTGWDRHWQTDAYGVDAPFVDRAAAELLVDQRVALVGIDSVNIDDTGDPSRPAHSLLLGAGIPIVEHLCGLDALPARGFRFHAVPPPVVGMGTFPVRAYAVV